MANVHDVAAYILQKQGHMTAMKLQKLVYYSQAWHLVWEERPLFTEKIEAWANGPVAPALYSLHRGRFAIHSGDLGPVPEGALDQAEVTTIDSVIDFYAPQTAMYLSDLTHREAPWAEARGGLPPGQRSTAEITPAAMAEYYGSL